MLGDRQVPEAGVRPPEVGGRERTVSCSSLSSSSNTGSLPTSGGAGGQLNKVTVEDCCQRTTVTTSTTGPAYVQFVLQSHPLSDSSLSSNNNSGGSPTSEGAGEQSNKVVVEDLEQK